MNKLTEMMRLDADAAYDLHSNVEQNNGKIAGFAAVRSFHSVEFQNSTQLIKNRHSSDSTHHGPLVRKSIRGRLGES